MLLSAVLIERTKGSDNVTNRKARQPDLEVCHMPQRVPLIALNATFRLFRPPGLRATHFRQRHAPRVMYDEIIPDSEPEREEQRRRLDEERRVKRTRKRLVPEPTRSMSFVLSSSPELDLSASFNPFVPYAGSLNDT